MIFILSVLVSTCLAVCFKLFAARRVNTFNAIVINYTLCLLLGSWFDPDSQMLFSPAIVSRPWFPYSMALGVLFIAGFTLTAYAVQTAGITLNAIAQRMSIVASVPATVIFFHERFGLLEMTGLILAIVAIIAINRNEGSFSLKIPGRALMVLAAVLLISAVIEVFLLFLERKGLAGDDQMALTSYGFGASAITGWIIIGWLWIIRRHRISLRDVYAGMILGLPNFLSIYFVLVMLNRGWNGSILYPMINVSVLLLSAFVAVAVFREKLSRTNRAGIVMASLAILVIGYAHYLHQ